MNQAQEQAADLVMILHRSINWDIWGKLRRRYWTALEENLTGAAYTTSLPKFLNSICSKMSIDTPGRNAKDRQRLDEILNAGQDRAVLRVFREEVQLPVLTVRVLQADKKAAREFADLGYLNDTEDEDENLFT